MVIVDGDENQLSTHIFSYPLLDGSFQLQLIQRFRNIPLIAQDDQLLYNLEQ